MGEARDIYTAACTQIAAALVQDGFRYRTSKQALVSQDGDLTREITFQSSFRNFVVPETGGSGFLQRAVSWLPGTDLVTFGNVSLIAHAAIRSKAIKLWRASLKQPLGLGDVVTGGLIGNLQDKPKWIQFNLANPRRRDQVIGDVIDLIRTVVLPYMGHFSDPQQVVRGLLEGTLPWDWEPSALEYIACFGTLQQCQDLLARYLQTRSEQMEEYRERIREYRENGVPEAFDSRAPGRLAKAALTLGLEPT